jgi:hypothetical protein
MIAGTKNLAGIDQHCPLTNGGKVMLNLESFDRCAVRDHAFQKIAKGRDIPLPVSEVVYVTSLGLLGARAEHLIERPIGGCDVQVFIKDDKGAWDRFNNVTGINIGQCSLL